MPMRTRMLGLAVLFVFGCGPESQDEQFVQTANEYLEELLADSPEFATYLGDHRYDDKLGDYSREGIERSLAREKRYLSALDASQLGNLEEGNASDYEILRNHIESSIYQTKEIREYEWNPLVYNTGGSIYGLIAREFAPLDQRLRNAKARLEKIPTVLEAARANLQTPPKVHTETAILQNQGAINLIRNQLAAVGKGSPELLEELASAQESAIAALEEFGKWLEDDLLPRSTGEFRLGEAKFRRKLAYTLHSDLSMEKILRRAEQRRDETASAMYETALPLHKEYFPGAATEDRTAVIRAVLNRLADDHPTNETIVGDARRSLDEVTEFTSANSLVSLPSEPLEIIVMPEFQRGVSTAYCDSPGPLEKNAKTFYAISPTPKDWTEQRAVSFFREYNDYMLHNLTVHEATPGHYLQLAHSNRYQGATLIRSVFYSGTFVEGWGTYAEQLMAEHGYGGPQVKMQMLKMYMRSIINAIIDQKIHAGSMTEQEAMDMMMNVGFQEDGEAAGKWRRATLTSAQLSTYFVGNAEINDIRTAYAAKHGPIEDWQSFHAQLLSYGSPPAKYVKRLMGL